MQSKRNVIISVVCIISIIIALFFLVLNKKQQNKVIDNNELTQRKEYQEIYVDQNNLTVHSIDNSNYETTQIVVKEIVQEEIPQTENTENFLDIEISNSKWEIGEEVPIPDLPTNVKVCTDYHCYNLTGTPHYRMQTLCYTDDYGMRRFNDDYCVGLGSFYSTEIGHRFEITLENGNIFTIITGDQKKDCHTDETNMYAPCINYDGDNAANVLEFIIDRDVIEEEMYQYGGVHYYDEFDSDIVKMVYLGRDTNYDWDTYY